MGEEWLGGSGVAHVEYELRKRHLVTEGARATAVACTAGIGSAGCKVAW
jgi:hypothetical protein